VLGDVMFYSLPTNFADEVCAMCIHRGDAAINVKVASFSRG
jgi:hypothetical protein